MFLKKTHKLALPLIIIFSTVSIFTSSIISIISCIPGINEKLIRVGAKGFTEQYIIGTIISLILEENGFTVREVFGAGSMIIRMGLITGQIDMYPEYTGTAWTLYLSQKEKVDDPQELYARVKEIDFNRHKLVWLPKTSINNTYALAVRKDDAKKLGTSLTQLSKYIKYHKRELVFGIAHEFYQRPDGFKEMLKAYGIEIPESNIKTMDIGLSFEAISRKQIDVAMIYSTDGKLKKYDLVLLEDDKKFFPVYNLCFVMREDILRKYPELKNIFKDVTEILTNESILEMNYQVDVKGKPAILVAKDFLKKNGLIR